jgi:hypothetical protein
VLIKTLSGISMSRPAAPMRGDSAWHDCLNAGHWLRGSLTDQANHSPAIAIAAAAAAAGGNLHARGSSGAVLGLVAGTQPPPAGRMRAWWPPDPSVAVRRWSSAATPQQVVRLYMSDGELAATHSAAAACCMVPVDDVLSLQQQGLLHVCSAARWSPVHAALCEVGQCTIAAADAGAVCFRLLIAERSARFRSADLLLRSQMVNLRSNIVCNIWQKRPRRNACYAMHDAHVCLANSYLQFALPPRCTDAPKISDSRKNFHRSADRRRTAQWWKR